MPSRVYIDPVAVDVVGCVVYATVLQSIVDDGPATTCIRQGTELEVGIVISLMQHILRHRIPRTRPRSGRPTPALAVELHTVVWFRPPCVSAPTAALTSLLRPEESFLVASAASL